jgi:uncharacterized membrane protein
MAQEFDTQLTSVAVNFMKSLKVPFTRKHLKKRLIQNPFYPSLFCVKQVLEEYNIECSGLKVESEQLAELPLPFLAYIKLEEIGSKDFVNVTEVTNDSITYFTGKKNTVSRNEFVERWSTNVVLLAESDGKSREQSFEKNKKVQNTNRSKQYLLWTGVTFILAYFICRYLINSHSLMAALSILIPTLLGLAISVLLLVHEIDKSNTFVKNICTGGVKTNCAAVLSSNAAKVFGVSSGEIGFFYFSFFILFLLNPGMPFFGKTPLISLFAILAAGYIPFSLLYQYIIVKQWCRLCLAIQGILGLDLLWVYKFGDLNISYERINYVSLICSLISPILLWYLLKPVIKKAKDSDEFLASYKRLSTRLDVFNLMLQDQKEILDGWQTVGGIEKGNPNADNIIFKVCSPVCEHCNTAYTVLNDLFIANHNVKLITIFFVTNDIDDSRRFPVKHFLALNQLGDMILLEKAMDYWYLSEGRDYSTLQQLFPVPETLLMEQEFKIDLMEDWCKKAEISYTPTFFINGRQLPSSVELPDLKDLFH